MSQTDIVKRIEEICNEFDARMLVVGVAIARLELAKKLAELEAVQQSVKSDCYPHAKNCYSVTHRGTCNCGALD